MTRPSRRQRLLLAVAVAALVAAVAAEVYVTSSTARVEWVSVLETVGADDALAGFLADKKSAVANAAADALVRRGPAAVPALVRRLDQPDAPARHLVANVLGRIGPAASTARPALERWMTDDSDPGVRERAVVAVALVGRDDPGAVAALARRLTAAPEPDRVTVVTALGGMTEQAAAAAPVLAGALRDPAAGVRMAAAEAIEKLGPGGRGAVPALVDAVRAEENRKVRGELAETLEKLLPAITDDGLRDRAKTALTGAE